MKVLQIHNRYTKKGGEDGVVEAEKNLLLSYKHSVEQLFFENSQIQGFEKIKIFYKSIYNTQAQSILREKIRTFQPDIIHLHNLFYVASPAVLFEAQRQKIPLVQTIHNFRLICAGSLLMREGKVCEICTNKTFPIAGIKHKCFQNSAIKSAQLTMVTGLHKLLGTWKNKVDAYITLTDFVKKKLIYSSLHLPDEKIFIKPNFVQDKGFASIEQRQGFFLFVGRLSQEKGIQTLLDATKLHNFKLEIIGGGELENLVREYALSNPNIVYHGFQGQDFIFAKMKECKALLFPSVWYENMPLTILEAFSTGTPVIISDIDNLNEIVTNHYNGLHFRTGESQDLALKVQFFEQNPRPELYTNARKTYETLYSPEKNYEKLMQIYEIAIQRKRNLAK
ncbi:glycosyltransferase family 4 protein [Raineya orbicola]|jgi:glycosyltransferase involved in cell wall biosynthesis|uniref:Glycosyl transferases group 1 n=1 Tax=Raineya orbicola TaxID=2016530 RepID=A0A2N3IGD3_9BACT|nr:glycosyltransferase family 4 protein [Raineya orbicola]PKQ69351.1 Glycosyl transferases group 1 [Raineya orbicola]